MKKSLLIILSCFLAASSWAESSLDELYDKLQQDFESKPHFFNAALNDQRDGVMSPFIPDLFHYNYKNAEPLTPYQLKKLPDGQFLEREPFMLAMKGRERLLAAGKIKDLPVLAVADFSLHSRVRRFFIMDIKKGEVLINQWVSHATNSDLDNDGFAETFSNVSGSKQSSLGFMVADETYKGIFGYSRRLKGLDPELNSRVYSRAVVIHGFGGMGAHQAAWGNPATSEGCLMTSYNESGRFWNMEDKPMYEIVINTLKPGSLIFTYVDNDKIYKSKWIKPTDLN